MSREESNPPPSSAINISLHITNSNENNLCIFFVFLHSSSPHSSLILPTRKQAQKCTLFCLGHLNLILLKFLPPALSGVCLCVLSSVHFHRQLNRLNTTKKPRELVDRAWQKKALRYYSNNNNTTKKRQEKLCEWQNENWALSVRIIFSHFFCWKRERLIRATFCRVFGCLGCSMGGNFWARNVACFQKYIDCTWLNKARRAHNSSSSSSMADWGIDGLADSGDAPSADGCVVGAESGPVRLGLPNGLASTAPWLRRFFFRGLSEYASVGSASSFWLALSLGEVMSSVVMCAVDAPTWGDLLGVGLLISPECWRLSCRMVSHELYRWGSNDVPWYGVHPRPSLPDADGPLQSRSEGYRSRP